MNDRRCIHSLLHVTVYFAFRFYLTQKENPKILWKDSDTLQDITTTELVVSGVYLKLFISNPGWTLRKPKQFLSDLLDFVADNISRSGCEVCVEMSKRLKCLTFHHIRSSTERRLRYINNSLSITTKRSTELS